MLQPSLTGARMGDEDISSWQLSSCVSDTAGGVVQADSLSLGDRNILLKDLNMKIIQLLDKLTALNCAVVAGKLCGLSFDSVDKVERLASYIFYKAISIPELSATYAALCKNLMFSGNCEWWTMLQRSLLKICQTEFEKDRATEYGVEEKLTEIVKEPSEEKRTTLRLQLVKKLQMLRMRSVAVSRFLGELYLTGIVNTVIIRRCIELLLESADEEDLECLCVLMTIVGKVLEEKMTGMPTIHEYFSKMEDILNERKTSTEVSIMLKEVILLKNDKWISRKVESNSKEREPMDLKADLDSLAQKQLIGFSTSELPDGMVTDVTKSKEGKAAKNVTKDVQLEEPNVRVDDSQRISNECKTIDLVSNPMFKESEKIATTNDVEDKPASSSFYIASSNFILGNIYEKGQWSPINPQGEKIYGRDFLIGLQYSPLSLRKPDFTINVDCILPYDLNRDDVAVKLKKTGKEILSHLTNINYDEVAVEMMQLQINDDNHLRAVVNTFFEQAVSSSFLSESYAVLCMHLDNANFGWQALKDDCPTDNFKKVLLKCFEREFKKKKPASGDMTSRLRSYGVTRFLGQLYKLGMITDSILVMCIKNLLNSGDDFSLEQLCTFVSERKIEKH